VLPWDVLAPANADALAVVEQALAFAMPAEPWPAVEGLPLPVSFGVRNPGGAPRWVRIEVSVGSDLVLEVWNSPVTTDPPAWELDVQPGATAAATVWLRPGAGALELPYTVTADDGSGWAPLESGTFTVEVAPFDPRRALRELDAALVECGAGIDDPGALAVLRDLRSAVDRVAATPSGDRTAAASALRELARAFAAAGDEPLPCLAAARGRIADLVVAWQIRWTAGGEAE
jgi:hypothetical protein